ncbi:DUF4328 domain-containing protein [Streptomyces sp.]|uniref:DUF4328 domain-containing protein n=1 Tax=Streptomyces sp. TaxID=1931 RepID=UPI002811D143|nr:DUF4328 domain-containing protein [Streptomyces sp.]
MLRDPKDLAFAVTALLGATVLADALALHAGSELWTAVTDSPSGDVSPRDLARALVVGTALLQALLLVATGTVFVIWFHRLRLNAEVWAGDVHSRTPGWAIGGWFIPVAGLWIPCAIATEIWRASRPDPSAPDRRGEFLLLRGWWLVFVADLVLARVAAWRLGRAETFEAYASAARWLLASDALDMAAAVLAILFVRRLTSMQHAKATGMISAAQ